MTGVIKTMEHKNLNRFTELEYRRKWLYQLQCEFEMICRRHRIALGHPAFRITDSRTVLGAWDPTARTISISSALIGEYSWDAVINVLKHEMAHQYVHESLGRGAELPHGPAFVEACGKLAVSYPYNTATGDSPKLFSAMPPYCRDPEHNRMTGELCKMLSLAGSANEHEAAAAMRKANSFIRKYNLERLDKSKAPSQYRYAIKNTGKKRLHVIDRRIAGLLMDFFYVDVVYAELFDAGMAEHHKTVELLGTLENVSFAEHVYDFLKERAECLWRDYKKTFRAPGKLHKTYVLGILQGFREKLEAAEKNQPVPPELAVGKESGQNVSALVVARDLGLVEFVAKRFPRLRKVRYGAAEISCTDTYLAGKRAGRKITVHKTVEQKDGNRGKMLSR